MVRPRPQLPVSTYACLALCSARWCPSSTRLVVSPSYRRRSSSRSFPFVGFPGGDTRCPSLILYCSWRHLCRSTSVFWLVQSRLWPLSFLLPRCLFFCPVMWFLTSFFYFIFVCAAVTMFFAWLLRAIFPRHKSLLDVRISCRLVCSSRFECYPWRCRGTGRIPSNRPCIFIEFHVLVFVCDGVTLSR